MYCPLIKGECNKKCVFYDVEADICFLAGWLQTWVFIQVDMAEKSGFPLEIPEAKEEGEYFCPFTNDSCKKEECCFYDKENKACLLSLATQIYVYAGFEAAKTMGQLIGGIPEEQEKKQEG